MGAAGVKPNEVTLSTLVHGWAKKGDMARAQEVVERTGAAGVKPDEVTKRVLTGVARLSGHHDNKHHHHHQHYHHREQPPP